MKSSLFLYARNFVSLLFLFGFTLNPSIPYAQNPEPVYRRYTVDNGLPSSVVYHVFQDTKGFIWFATANGVSKYDGYSFENFDLQSGLVDNDVFEIFEDYKYRIWFIPMSGKLSYYENGKVTPYRFNDKIKGHLPSSRGPVKCSFYVDSLDYVYLSLKRFGRISISPEGVYKKYLDEKDLSLNVEQLPNGKILISNSESVISKKIAFKGIYQNFNISLNTALKATHFDHHHLFCLSAPDGSVVCSMLDHVFKVKNGSVIADKNFKQGVLWASIDNDNNLWVAIHQGGVKCYANYDIEKEERLSLLNNSQVTSVLKDNEGAYWFSSLNDGVFYCSNIYFKTYTKENGLLDNRINAVMANKDGVYIGYEFGFVDLLKKDRVEHFVSNNPVVKNSSVRSMFIDSLNRKIFVSSIDNLYWIENKHVVHLDRLYPYGSLFPRMVVKSDFGGYWLGTTIGLYKFDGEKIVVDPIARDVFKGLIFALAEDKKGDVWFVTINGLWKYSKGVYKYLGNDDPLLAQPGTSLLVSPVDSSIWIGTNGCGIVVYKNDVVFHITKKDGLISNSINKLYFAKSNVWVATKQGLSSIVLNNGKIDIKNFTTANGLPTNEASSVVEYNDTVYVGTPKGLTVFNKFEVSEIPSPANIVISKFRINNNQVDLLSRKMELYYDQNALNIDFVGFVYRNAGKVNYRYRMVGSDTAWVQTQTPNCLYNGLPSGSYVFEVEAQSYNGVWSSKPASISFTIHPPFWKKLWFLVLGTTVFSVLIFIIYKVRVNEINRRSNLLQNINLYKQQSLRQQMNPHFIFNTLNSIQLYILEKDPISSHRYLTKFARLMRMTLDNSLNSTIPLRDEIDALRLYLDLERLRFEDKFEHSIDIGAVESILNYKIPTLLIQPFVENAIWHGISLMKDQIGCVKIKLMDNGNSITCIIEDNGVGRKQADEVRRLKNKEYKSRGSQITQQRVDLLSLMYKEKFSIYYDDLNDSQGVSLGTRVTIVIPKEISAIVQM